MHYTLQKKSVRQHNVKKNENIRHSSSAFYQELCTTHTQGNNQFGKWFNPITKTEFTLSIFSSAFHKQGNEKWILIVLRLAKKKGRKKEETIRHVSSDVTVSEMVMHQFAERTESYSKEELWLTVTLFPSVV